MSTDRITALEDQVLRLTIKSCGVKHRLHDGAEADIAQRMRAVFYFDETGQLRSRAGETAADYVARLAYTDNTKYLFAQNEPPRTAGALSETELSKMTPMQKLVYANAIAEKNRK